MPASHPRIWLMTDERLGDDLWRALRRLPPGGGVVFRHYGLGRVERLRLFRRLRAVARARRLVLIAAGGPLPGADGVHDAHGAGLRTHAVHDRREALRARREGATVAFVSPVYPTRSHPGAPALGPVRAAWVARELGMAVIALGGMDTRRWRRIRRLGFDGWAGIDAFLPGPTLA